MSRMHIGRVDLNLLVVFDAIARNRSVTAAANELSLSQPAVSHALRRLREMLDDPLFVRGRTGLVLTPRAEGCATEVGAILAAVERVISDATFDPTTTERRFRLAASDYAVQTIVPLVARRLRQTASASTLEVSSMDAAIGERLQNGAIDIAFVGEPQTSEAIMVRELYQEHFVGVVCSTHPLAESAVGRGVSLSQYLAFPHVAVSFGGAGRSPIDVALSKLGRVRHIIMVTPSFATNISAVRRTDLVLSLPSRLAVSILETGFVSFKLPLDVPKFPYSMAWHRRTDDDPGLTWLRNLVAEVTSASRSSGSCS